MCYVRNNTLIPAPPPVLHAAAAAAAAAAAPSVTQETDSESFAALLDSAVAHVARKQQQQISQRSASLSSNASAGSTDSHGLPPQQGGAMSLMDELLMDSFPFDDSWLSPTDAGSDSAIATASANPTDFSLFGDASVAVLGDLGGFAPSVPAQPQPQPQPQPSAQAQRQMLLQQRAILDSLKSKPPVSSVVSPPPSASPSDEMTFGTSPESFKSDGARAAALSIGKKRPFEHMNDQRSSDATDSLANPPNAAASRKSSKKSAKARDRMKKFFSEQELMSRIKSLEMQLNESHRAMLAQMTRS
ncbi:hypothetical protein HDU84_005495 [Entophlyctis sp. JEL0112]|nr:hypothetical protein HDU84_005495 [Entophlyctis sp. JEL0112]